jgi:hypothetical protein
MTILWPDPLVVDRSPLWRDMALWCELADIQEPFLDRVMYALKRENPGK